LGHKSPNFKAGYELKKLLELFLCFFKIDDQEKDASFVLFWLRLLPYVIAAVQSAIQINKATSIIT
jgi:hypothetical protein